ncbi:hypothetical protein CR513_50111, partial [Mucuna pruriens]
MHDCATWISPNVSTILDKHWNKRLITKANRVIDKGAQHSIEIVEKTKKLNFGEWVNDKIHLKYQHCRQELQQSTTEEGPSPNDSNFASINNNDIVGGKNEKGNVYGLGKLTNKFMHSTHIPTNLIKIPMV